MQQFYRMQNQILEAGLPAGADRVICGLSGGADSVFLLRLLVLLRDEPGIRLRALHVHHGIRGAEADRDEVFVRKLCEELCVPLTVRHFDVPKEAAAHGLSLEEMGRILRRQAFREAAEAWLREEASGGGIFIALAHHMDDLAESVLFRAARGTGVTGLAAMRPVSLLDGDEPRIRILRPLLGLRRREIEEALHENGFAYCTDSTNAEADAARNRIRHHVLPLLISEVNSGAAEHLSELASSAAETADFLMAEAEDRYPRYVRADGTGLLIGETLTEREMPAMVSGILRMAAAQAAGSARDLGRVHIRDLRALLGKETGKRLDLPGGLIAERVTGGVRLMRREETAEAFSRRSADAGRGTADACPAVPLLPGEEAVCTGLCLPADEAAGKDMCYPTDGTAGNALKVTADFAPAVPKVIEEKRYTKYIDYGKIKGTLLIRTRRPGDYLVTRSDGARKRLSDYFTDEKVPKEKRDSIPLVADGSEIVWVIGMRLGYSYRITEETSQALVLKVFNNQEADYE